MTTTASITHSKIITLKNPKKRNTETIIAIEVPNKGGTKGRRRKYNDKTSKKNRIKKAIRGKNSNKLPPKSMPVPAAEYCDEVAIDGRRYEGITDVVKQILKIQLASNKKN